MEQIPPQTLADRHGRAVGASSADLGDSGTDPLTRQETAAILPAHWFIDCINRLRSDLHRRLWAAEASSSGVRVTESRREDVPDLLTRNPRGVRALTVASVHSAEGSSVARYSRRFVLQGLVAALAGDTDRLQPGCSSLPNRPKPSPPRRSRPRRLRPPRRPASRRAPGANIGGGQPVAAIAIAVSWCCCGHGRQPDAVQGADGQGERAHHAHLLAVRRASTTTSRRRSPPSTRRRATRTSRWRSRRTPA